MSEMQFVLCSLGTRGDIAPFAALARALVTSGHCVTLLTNSNWENLARASGAHFAAIAPKDPTQTGRNDRAFFESCVLPSFATSFDAVMKIHQRDPRVAVVYKMGMLGAQCAAELLRLPNYKVALQPAAIRSTQRPSWPLSRLAQSPLRPVARRVVIPALYALRELTTPYRRHTNAFRISRGLAPISLGVVNRCEDATIVMCPKWFATPQSDWPPNCHFPGFPFDKEEPLADDLREFIGQHGAPLVFTPGTGVTRAHEFFRTAERVCLELRMPGVFLSATAPVPIGLAPVHVRAFAGLGGLLPHSRLLVHHGGIGTTAQAIRAGIPQVILPGRFDQPDNAMRVATLRLGAVTLTARPDPKELYTVIDKALHDPALRQRLAIANRDVREADAAAAAARILIRLLQTHETQPLWRAS